MPEGQVSHRNAIRLGAALTGREILDVLDGPRTQAQRIPDRLVGDVVTRAEAVGKHHLLRFASGRTLHSHLMMRGRWRLQPAGSPLGHGGLWLALVTDEWIAAQYNGSVLRLYEPGQTVPRLAALGPDLIASEDPASDMRTALARCDPRTPVGEALLDQRVTSGIGNVYRSETCFLAGVDTWRPVSSLTANEAAALGRIAAELLRDGVRTGGPITTFRPPPGSRSRGRTWVYGRGGLPCHRCGATILARGQGDQNRIAYWCPECQPAP